MPHAQDLATTVILSPHPQALLSARVRVLTVRATSGSDDTPGGSAEAMQRAAECVDGWRDSDVPWVRAAAQQLKVSQVRSQVLSSGGGLCVRFSLLRGPTLLLCALPCR